MSVRAGSRTSGGTLVTGASGFVGSHLVPALEAEGERVVSLRKPGLPASAWGREWLDADLRNASDVQAAVRQVEPERVVHLAAVAYPPDAASDPHEALQLNYAAVHHLVVALERFAPRARLLYVGTAQVYGARPVDAAPLDEESALAPDSLYAASKAAAEARLALAVERTGLHVIVARPFNHSGAGRPPVYAESAFARQLALIERGEQEPVLRVGNLSAVRDFSDVRDVVRAYALLLERGRAGQVFNVCSGRALELRELVELLLAHSARTVRIEVDASRYRPLPPERRALVGDPARLRALGWQPRYRFEETLAWLLDDWRARA